MSKTPSDNSRRRFIKLGVIGLAAAPLGNLLLSPCARAQEAAKVEETDPMAVQLGYKRDASQIDKAKYPQHTDQQFCHNCQLYAGKSGEQWGPCSIFGGKLVAANGWCSAWTAKPA